MGQVFKEENYESLKKKKKKLQRYRRWLILAGAERPEWKQTGGKIEETLTHIPEGEGKLWQLARLFCLCKKK